MRPNELDKTAFDTRVAVLAAKNEPGYYKKLTWQERLQVANYLNSIKYNYPENDPPKMDKTVFKMRARNENPENIIWG